MPKGITWKQQKADGHVEVGTPTLNFFMHSVSCAREKEVFEFCGK